MGTDRRQVHTLRLYADGGIPGVIESVRSGVMGKRQWKRWIEISTILNPLEIIIDVMHKHGLEVVSGN